MAERSMEVIRGRCYHIAGGLELALRENLLRNFDIQDSGFFNQEEKTRAFKRAYRAQRTDYSQDDLRELLVPGDFLEYLDLGDLCNLLNRHKASVRDAKQEHIQEATKIINHKDLDLIEKRNRVMHFRTLHGDEYATLQRVAYDLRRSAPSMEWERLAEGVDLAESGEPVEIPSYWTIPNNLPEPDYEDTGFIGRREERNELKRILDSRRDVITVVGEGGRGKTALALRVCLDLVESGTDLDRIVWISLKNQYLTGGGVRDIENAVLDEPAIVENFGEAVGDKPELGKSAGWDAIIDVMKKSKILLVVDNLETLEGGVRSIRDLASNIPEHSKLLLTTRVGLGEIEERYAIPPLSARDSRQLLRKLGRALAYEPIARLSDKALNGWCKGLDHNPLLMRWFVSAVAKGAEPRAVFVRFSESGYDAALRFCWDNVYRNLSDPAKRVVSVLLAAAQDLTRTQIRALADMNAVEIAGAMDELGRANIVKRELREDGVTETVAIASNLIHSYLMRNYPPELDLMDDTDASFARWQGRYEASVKTFTHRYSQNSILIATLDEAIVARYLNHALESMSIDMDKANEALRKAEDLLPDWWEVHRVKAHILEAARMPQNAIINAYKQSIEYKALDVNRHHYAKYLMNVSFPRFDAVVEQIDLALEHPDAAEPELKSMRGVALVRLGKIEEGIKDLEDAWDYDYAKAGLPALAPHLRLRLGTQLVDAYRRQLEYLYKKETSQNEAAAVAVCAFRKTSEVAKECGWNGNLVEKALDLIDEISNPNFGESVAESLMTSYVSKWDSSQDFLNQVPNIRDRARKRLNIRIRFREIAKAIPNTSKMVENLHTLPRVSGVVEYIHQDRSFGKIRTTTEFEDVYMTRGSFRHPREWETLETGQRVSFSVVRAVKGPRAIKVELTDDTQTAPG